MKFKELIGKLDPVDIYLNESIYGDFTFATIRSTFKTLELKHIAMSHVTDIKPFVIEASVISLICDGDIVVNSIGMNGNKYPPVLMSNLIVTLSDVKMLFNMVRGNITRSKISCDDINLETHLSDFDINREVNKMINEISLKYRILERINESVNNKIEKYRKN